MSGRGRASYGREPRGADGGFRPREIVFDKSNREEYLKGFHKRNLERKERAQQRQKEIQRQDRLNERREIRERKKQELQERLEFAKQLYEGANGLTDMNDSSESNEEEEEEEWHGITSDQDSTELLKPVGILKTQKRQIQKFESELDHDDDDRDSLINGEATVVIEQIDSSDEENRRDPSLDKQSNSDEVLRNSLVKAGFYAKRVEKIMNGRRVPPKKPKKKFRYLTPQERKANAKKERMRGKRSK
ncbi:nucleolar protein 12-domain-containing protein [Dipodascopsis uninucleata]